MAENRWVRTAERLPPDVNKQYIMIDRRPWLEDKNDNDYRAEYDILIVNFGQGAHNFPEDFVYWMELPELPDDVVKPPLFMSNAMYAENWEKGEEEIPRGTPDTMTDSKENQTE